MVSSQRILLINQSSMTDNDDSDGDRDGDGDDCAHSNMA